MNNNDHNSHASNPAKVVPVGSPFVVGRPLRAHEKLYGREPELEAIAQALRKFESVNIVAERRMGKTSFINHLVHRFNRLPVLLGKVNLQSDISNPEHFYATALSSMKELSSRNDAIEQRVADTLKARCFTGMRLPYAEFQKALSSLREIRIKPVIVIDEFERLLEPSASAHFRYPDFFNWMRALMTDDLLAMVVASRRTLAEYFKDPARPDTLTSTFPTYFIPLPLPDLIREAAMELLLQSSEHQLSLFEADIAWQWAGGHPCYVQIAGDAQYQAKAEHRPPGWTQRRREELKDQNCMTGLEPKSVPLQPKLTIGRLMGWMNQSLTTVGRLVQWVGDKLHEFHVWWLGLTAIVLVVILLVSCAFGWSICESLLAKLGVVKAGSE